MLTATALDFLLLVKPHHIKNGVREERVIAGASYAQNVVQDVGNFGMRFANDEQAIEFTPANDFSVGGTAEI